MCTDLTTCFLQCVVCYSAAVSGLSFSLYYIHIIYIASDVALRKLFSLERSKPLGSVGNNKLRQHVMRLCVLCHHCHIILFVPFNQTVK
jgi:hypothetical protein